MGRAPIGEMFIELGLDTTKFSKGTTGARNAVKFFSSEVRALDNVMKSSGRSVEALGRKHQALGKQIEAQKKLIDQLYKAYNDPNISQGRRDTLAAQIGNETAKLKAMEGQLKSVNAELNRLAQPKPFGLRLEEAGKSIDAFGQKMQNIGKGISSVGDGFTKTVTAPIVAGAGLAIKAAIDYESAFAGVKKTVDGTAQDFDKLSGGIRKMALELPASAVEIANVAEAAGQLGIKKEDILSFSRTMIDLGESTNLSATEAATAIAKMANITGLTADEYSRFGSSIVALGNNFATTEADIVNMSTRMASAGTIAGLTNQEILALATAMSSVGIEAEAGGTAMSQTLAAIGKAVDQAGEDVQKFANVAGMSAEEFSAKWREKPIEAIQAFIQGLGSLDEKGESATQVLDDLGLSGIRQSNMLKALGLASGELSRAVETSNRAWDENKALTDEASKRYETTESKLKMLKNQVTDLAIEFGGPLLDALRDAIDAGKPLIQWASNLAKKFSSLSKEQQQSILKFVGLAAAIGPVLSMLGRSVSGIGTLVSGFGKLTGATGKVVTAFKGVGTAAQLASGASGVAGMTTSAGALGSALGFLATPAGAATVAIAALTAAALYFSVEASKAQTRALEWGTAVNETQARELQNFKDKVDQSNQALATFGKGGVEEVNNVRTAMQGLVDEITKLTDENLAKNLDLAEKLGFSQATIDEIKANAQGIKDNAQSMSDEVLQIYKNAKENRRALSEEEKAIVLNNQNELINKQIELLKYSGKEKEEIVKAMNGKVEELNTNQLQKALATTKKWVEDENKAYKERKKNLEDMYDSIKGSDDKALAARKEIKQKMEDLEADHQAKMDAYSEKYNRIQNELAKKLTFGTPEQRQMYINQVKKTMSELGLTYDEMQGKMEKFANSASQTSSLVARSMADMSEETRSANTTWNSMVLDPKTGKVKTNAKEEISKAIEAEGGWEAMQFTLKHANLESNARIMVAEALMEAGKWDALSPEEKSLVVNNSAGLQAIVESEQHLAIWNSMPEEVKKIMGENTSFLASAENAKRALDSWNVMPAYEKDILAKDLTSIPAEQAQARINELTGTTVPIGATDETAYPVSQAGSAINGIVQNAPVDINATNQAQPPATAAQSAIDAVKQKAPTDINAKDNASSKANGVMSALNAIPRNITVAINAVGNAVSKFLGLETGTDYHMGGPAMVNDQKGPLYKELITLPSGKSFIPQGRNVVLDLPKGTKVLPAKKTRDLMQAKGIPKYKDGIGFPDNSFIFKEFSSDRQTVKTTDSTAVLDVLKQILLELKFSRNQKGNGTGDIYFDLEKVGRMIQQKQDQNKLLWSRMRGEID